MATKEEKARKLVEEDAIWCNAETERYEYYMCRGKNDIYDIIYFKGTDTWKCNCGNIKETTCYHIEAAIILKEKEDSKDDYIFSKPLD